MLWGPVDTMGLPAFKIQKHMPEKHTPEKHGSLTSVHSLPPLWLLESAGVSQGACSDFPGKRARWAQGPRGEERCWRASSWLW